MTHLIKTLHDVLQARSVEQVWGMHTRAMEAVGFDRIMFGHTRFRSSTGYVDREDLMVLSNFPDTYARPFIDTGLFQHSPMMQWAAENTGAMSWSWIGENLEWLPKKCMEVIEFNQKNGVYAGYTISFQETDARHKAAIAMAARPGLSQSDVDKIWKDHGTEIEVLNQVAHLKLISLPYEGRKKQLTPRQREVLEWVGDGKTTADIATILAVSSAAVEKHMRLARESLGVDTTAQAVLKASVQNQIFQLDNG